MTQPYYVEPDYWVAGYAYGDVGAVAAVGSAYAASSARVDLVRLAAMSGAASGSTTSAALIILHGVSSQGMSLSASSVATLVRQARLLIDTASSASSNAGATRGVASVFSLAASPSVTAQRRFATSAAAAMSAIIAASARYKWLDEAVTSEIWTQRAAASDTWTPAASDATDWTET